MTKSFDREPYLKHSNAAPYEPRVEQTLNEYIARKEEGPPRITFDEWWKQQTPIYGDKPFEYMVCAAEAAWNAAIKNGKIS